MALSDSRPDQHLKALLRVATPLQGRVSHGTQATFLTCCPHYPGRSKQVHDGCFPILYQPSPSIGRVGIYNCPFGACSRFTRVTACQVAAALWLTFVPRASAGRSPYPTARVATGMNRQFPGRDLHPLVTCAFVAHQ
jgi:hypothetical protein